MHVAAVIGADLHVQERSFASVFFAMPATIPSQRCSFVASTSALPK
jgi:hypothetical protein